MNIGECNIANLRQVSLYMTKDEQSVRSHPSENYMLASEVDTFVKAAIELHHSPGINPYSAEFARHEAEAAGRPYVARRNTAHLWEVVVSALYMDANEFWHTTPGLHLNGTGAKISLGWRTIAVPWRHPNLIAQEERIREEEDELEMRGE